MKLSTKPRYGARILAQIAVDAADGAPVSGREIARKQGLSEAYLEQIMIPLRGAGVVAAVRGRSGGYRLNRPAASVTLLEIIEIFEGRLELADTAGGGEAAGAPVFEAWTTLSETLRHEAAAITLAQLADDLRRQESRPPDFSI